MIKQMSHLLPFPFKVLMLKGFLDIIKIIGEYINPPSTYCIIQELEFE